MMTKILAKSAIETIQADGWRVFMEQTARYLTLYGSPPKIGRYWWSRLTTKGDHLAQVQGSWMRLDIHERGIHSDLFISGIREPQATRYLQSILKPEWTVVDIGANIGYYALQEARVAKTVFAIEPGQDNFDHLQENIDLNGYKNVIPFQLAIGDHKGEVGFKVAKACNWNRIALDGETPDDQVPMATLDDFMGGLSIDFVRMDVEGYEIKILEGMTQILKKQRPRMFIEVHRDLLKQFGSNQTEFMGLLAEYDYRIEKSYISAREGPVGRIRTLLTDPDTRKKITERGIASHMFFIPNKTCGECLYWDNKDDPRESCKVRGGSDDAACGAYAECWRELGNGNRDYSVS